MDIPHKDMCGCRLSLVTVRLDLCHVFKVTGKVPCQGVVMKDFLQASRQCIARPEVLWDTPLLSRWRYTVGLVRYRNACARRDPCPNYDYDLLRLCHGLGEAEGRLRVPLKTDCLHIVGVVLGKAVPYVFSEMRHVGG